MPGKAAEDGLRAWAPASMRENKRVLASGFNQIQLLSVCLPHECEKPNHLNHQDSSLAFALHYQEKTAPCLIRLPGNAPRKATPLSHSPSILSFLPNPYQFCLLKNKSLNTCIHISTELYKETANQKGQIIKT